MVVFFRVRKMTDWTVGAVRLGNGGSRPSRAGGSSLLVLVHQYLFDWQVLRIPTYVLDRQADLE